MAIVKQLFDNKYISLYTEDNITIWSKLALYNSTSNEQYEIITNVVITIDNKPFYKVNEIHIPHSNKKLINIADYVEKIVAVIKYTTFEEYNKRIILDKFFKDSKTIQLNLIYKSILADLKHEKEIQEYNNYISTVKELTDNIISLANSKDIFVCIDNINDKVRFLKGKIGDRSILSMQNNKDTIERFSSYDKEQIKDVFIIDIEPQQKYNISEWILNINLLKDAEQYLLSI